MRCVKGRFRGFHYPVLPPRLMTSRLLRFCQDKLLGTLDNKFLAKELMLAYFADGGKEISSKVCAQTSRRMKPSIAADRFRIPAARCCR